LGGDRGGIRAARRVSSHNETVAELRAEFGLRYGGYCCNGRQKLFNAWDVSKAILKQDVRDYWLSYGFGG
jgi:hypothetical protein